MERLLFFNHTRFTLGRIRMIENHKIVLYRQSDGSWAAYVPSIPGCHAIMPTREQVLQELDGVFTMIQLPDNPMVELVSILTLVSKTCGELHVSPLFVLLI